MGIGFAQGTQNQDLNALSCPSQRSPVGQATTNPNSPSITLDLKGAFEKHAPAGTTDRFIQATEVVGAITDFCLQLRSSMQGVQDRVADFALSTEVLPEQSARDLLGHISSVGKQLHASLTELNRHIPDLRELWSDGWAGDIEHLIAIESISALPVTVASFIKNTALLSAHLSPLVQCPGGDGPQTIEAFIKAKEVAASSLEDIGKKLTEGFSPTFVLRYAPDVSQFEPKREKLGREEGVFL